MSRAWNIERIVTGVVRQAVLDANAEGVVLLDDGSPEAKLLGNWLEPALGAWFYRIPGYGPDEAGREADARGKLHALAAEQNLLTASPVNKTVLLLAEVPVPEALIPLGDLYASEVGPLADGWRGARNVHSLEALCGGIEALDAALRARFEERTPLPEVLARLPEAARMPFAHALERGRFARSNVGIVPKLGTRTAGIDLFA